MRPNGSQTAPLSPKACCTLCGQDAPPVAASLGVCLACIRSRPEAALALAKRAHTRSRRAFSLPPQASLARTGIQCRLCAWECSIGEGERGYCGLRTVRDGQLVHLAGTQDKGLLHWYQDPLLTNCVAGWVCEGHSRPGDHNLAVFYGSCTLNCLFCQNWQYRTFSPLRSRLVPAEEMAETANHHTFCVCFCGGDPVSQMPHALAVAHLLAGRHIRICWETNGMMHPQLLNEALRLSLESKGCIKFDLKAFDETLHLALTGGSNRRTLENFGCAAAQIPERPVPPLVVASTLLIPGYVDAEEVSRIATYIARCNRDIPYTLLAYAPHFFMTDLPSTSISHAEQALAAAQTAGLTRVRLGNQHLLTAPVS